MISQQRKWQLKMKREGRCAGCGLTIYFGGTYCYKCRAKRAARQKQNRRLKKKILENESSKG